MSYLLTGLFILFSSAAQAEEANVKIEDYRIDEKTKEGVAFVVSVEDDDGNPIENVCDENDEDQCKKAFKVEVAKNTGGISIVSDADRFVNTDNGFGTLLLIDNSGTMRKAWEEVKAAAKDYIDGMKGNDRVMLAVFSDRIRGLENGWLEDKNQLKGLVDGLNLRRGTNHNTFVWEAINEGLLKIGDVNDKFNTIIVLTDGWDESNRRKGGAKAGYGYDNAVDKARRWRIPVNTVAFLPNTKLDGRDSLERMAKDTNAEYEFAQTPDVIRERFRSVQEKVHNLWVLEVGLSNTLPGTYPASVEVFKEGDKDQSMGKDSTKIVLEKDLRGEKGEGTTVGEAKEEAEKINYVLIGGISLIVIGGIAFLIHRSREKAKHAQKVAMDKIRADQQKSMQAMQNKLNQAEGRTSELQDQMNKQQEALQKKQNISAPIPGPAPQGAPMHQAQGQRRVKKTMFMSHGSGGTHALVEPSSGQSFPLFPAQGGQQQLYVGADPARSQVVIAYESVSGQHAMVSLQNSQVFIQDSGSTNGTLVNGQDIRGQGPVALTAGCTVQLGQLRLIYN